jgi:hypothetical protein
LFCDGDKGVLVSSSVQAEVLVDVLAEVQAELHTCGAVGDEFRWRLMRRRLCSWWHVNADTIPLSPSRNFSSLCAQQQHTTPPIELGHIYTIATASSISTPSKPHAFTP